MEVSRIILESKLFLLDKASLLNFIYPMEEIKYSSTPKTVQDVVYLFENKHLNLSPGFQRDSVWGEKDRQKLIDSIIRNYPLPAIFFYKRIENGEIIYDVIDGKQRLETILKYMGKIKKLGFKDTFKAEIEIPGIEGKKSIDYNSLCLDYSKQHLLTAYKLQIIEVEGSVSDIIDLFIRINSTGKALTPAEKRHAKYYEGSALLIEAKNLGNKYKKYLTDNKIISETQISRMKHHELMCELMVSIHKGCVQNKKQVVDSIMVKNSISKAESKKIDLQTAAAIENVKAICTGLRETRLSQLSDYYSLVILISAFNSEKLILIDKKRNKQAWEVLTKFSAGVDEVRELQKKAKGCPPYLETCREYLLTVQQGSDEVGQRNRREAILRNLLQSIFEAKDNQRLFSSEQRRIIWHSDKEKVCVKCGKPVTWDDYTTDHVKAHSKGGQTDLKNASIMHRTCNSSKGNRKLKQNH